MTEKNFHIFFDLGSSKIRATAFNKNDKDQNYSYETMTQDQKVNMYNFISNFEESKKKKKAIAKKKTSTNLELFMGAV